MRLCLGSSGSICVLNKGSNGLLNGLDDGSECDLVATYASRIAIEIIGEMLRYFQEVGIAPDGCARGCATTPQTLMPSTRAPTIPTIAA